MLAVCVFNEGSCTLLKILEILGVKIGPNSHDFVSKRDEQRVRMANKQNEQSTKDARIAKKKELQEQEEAYAEQFGLLYGPGIDD